MSDKTISESLFEQFCGENKIKYYRIENGNTKTPDYDIYLDEQLVITEVKQFDSNDQDQDNIQHGRSKGTILFWEEPGHRVRIKINKARKQLKQRSKGQHPAVLVLYDNVPAGSVDFEDIKTAMYGHETIKLAIPEKLENQIMVTDIGFGSERKFTPNDNTTFSAVALLYRKHASGPLCLSVFHNIYAKNPIDPSRLRRETVRHFTLDPKIRGTLQEWCEI